MRNVAFVISLIFTIALIFLGNTKFGVIPPLGKLLSPSHGFWKNAEPVNIDFSDAIKSGQLNGDVNVYLDDRLVPHIFAENDEDAYFAQGWLHARFRLWQMEFQTHAAAGRLCEILGEKIDTNSVLEGHDRKFRRMGMNYAAENAIKYITKNQPETLKALEAYANGVNAYIKKLKPEDYPIEYKILDYAPEAWSPYKSALFLKYMSYDLANDGDDFAYTNLLNEIGIDKLEKMFPVMADSLSPIIPKGYPVTPSAETDSTGKILYPKTFAKATVPASVDSLYLSRKDTAAIAYLQPQTDRDNGSNNWVVSPGKTQDSAAILANDPHLGINLPSLWYELQIHTPTYNVYGVSFPGAPSVIIGFNDSIAWGVTNAMRDVMDFYEIQFKDSSMNEYLYNGEWLKTEWRTETISIRGKADYSEQIPMTVYGPVMYDGSYQSALKNGKTYAIKWKAHENISGFELDAFRNLNKAKNYDDYLEAIRYYDCPGQNFIFASKTGDIAWWQQASFPAKWRRQGDFIMPGWDSTYNWQFNIEQENNLHLKNPANGFIATANQLPTGDTLQYPYYLGGHHDLYRGIIINRMLNSMNGITFNDMEQMQVNNYNVFAEMALPHLLKHINESDLSADAQKLLDICKTWNFDAGAGSKAQTIFDNWWLAFEDLVWKDDVKLKSGLKSPWPERQTLLEGIIKDSAYPFIDDSSTPALETIGQMVTRALVNAAKKLPKDDTLLAWGAYKSTSVNHLLKIAPFNRANLNVGGGSFIINATKATHGPSWRMVVEMGKETKASGIYPGGQSGNPGSAYYDSFVKDWSIGKSNELWVMNANDNTHEKVKWTITFKKA